MGSTTFCEKWISLGSTLQDAISVCCYDGISNPVISCTLCGFCDASLKAYAGVVSVFAQGN